MSCHQGNREALSGNGTCASGAGNLPHDLSAALAAEERRHDMAERWRGVLRVRRVRHLRLGPVLQNPIYRIPKLDRKPTEQAFERRVRERNHREMALGIHEPGVSVHATPLPGAGGLRRARGRRIGEHRAAKAESPARTWPQVVRAIGVSPHQYIRIARFREAVRMIRANQFERLSDVAYDLS